MNVFELEATLGLNKDEYDKGLNDAEHKGESIGSKIGTGFANVAKAAGVALSAAAAGVVALTKKSVESYAEYEQLVGGVETLFGAQGMTLNEYAKSVGKTSSEVKGEYKNLMSAQDTVMKNASEAYKTAGLSANEYMETVTSFAAALNASLGGNTEKSAKAADQAIRDMSDNANKMGSSMESIQNAYQGFAKQNYTMLDNLKLGYGGTKEEMARLLADAEKISGQKFDLSNYADIVEAIHVVQTEMGITGTTAKEAEKTISGSLAMTKSAWENLVTGFTNPDADLGALINNVVDSASKAFENLMPAITQAMEGIGSFVEQIAPIISEKIPALVDAILPPLLSAATSLVSGLVSALPGIVTTLVEQIPTVVSSLINAVIETGPQFIDAAHQIFDMLVEGINEAIPTILALAPTVIMNFINGFTEALPIITEAAVSIMNTLSQGISTNLPILVSVAINALTELVSTLVANAGLLLDAGITLVTSIADGIMNSLPSITSAAMDLLDGALDTLTSNMPSFLDQGVEMITNLANGLLSALPQVLDGIGQIISKLLDFVIANFPTIMQNGMKLIINLAQGLIKALPNVIQSVVKIITGLVNQLIAAIPTIIQTGFKLIAQLALGLLKALPDIVKAALALAKGVIDTFTQTDWLSIGVNIIKGIISGIGSMAKMFLDAIVNLAKSAFDGIKNFFGIHSPSKKMRDEIGKNIVKGLIEGVDSEKKNAKKSAEELGALYVSAAKKKVEALKAQNKLSLDDELYYWQTVRDHIKKGTTAWDEATVQISKVQERITKSYMQEAEKRYKALKANNKLSLTEEVAYWEDVRNHYQKGTDEYLKATEKIGKAKQSIKKEVEGAEKEYQSGVEKIVKDLDDTITKLEKTYNDAVEKRYGDIMKSFGLFGEAKLDEGIGSQTLLNNLESQVKALDQWQEALTGLQNRLGDKSPDLYEELENMGVSSLETLKNLNSMTDTELNRYIELYGKKQEIAKAESEREHEELLAETQRQVEEAEQDAADKIATLTTSYEGKLKALGVSIKKKSLENGEQIPKGMWKGIKSQWGDLEAKTMDKVNSLVAKIQSALQIASPSKVFANEIGKWLPLGIEKGFTDAMPDAEKGMLSSIEDMKANMAGAVDMTTSVGGLDVGSSPVAMLLAGIYDTITGMDITKSMETALDATTFSINDREFARLVRAV